MSFDGDIILKFSSCKRLLVVACTEQIEMASIVVLSSIKQRHNVVIRLGCAGKTFFKGYS